jgi:hypothetical protein
MNLDWKTQGNIYFGKHQYCESIIEICGKVLPLNRIGMKEIFNVADSVWKYIIYLSQTILLQI